MKPYLLFFLSVTLLFITIPSVIAQAPTVDQSILPSPAGVEATKPALDVLRPVTPDEREGVDLLYWHFAKQMNHGVLFHLCV